MKCSIPIFWLYFLLMADQTKIRDPGEGKFLRRGAPSTHMLDVWEHVCTTPQCQESPVSFGATHPSKTHSSVLWAGVPKPAKLGLVPWDTLANKPLWLTYLCYSHFGHKPYCNQVKDLWKRLCVNLPQVFMDSTHLLISVRIYCLFTFILFALLFCFSIF